ncbi:MAG: hypothetical protein VKK59_00480 [Vampirovibrionales bacterium]|nr:hypothetical protein [Vampirovibrionales bacterium]
MKRQLPFWITRVNALCALKVSLVALFCLMLQGTILEASPVEAFWPFNGHKSSADVVSVMPPETAIADQCDPIKVKIQREFSRSFLIRPLMRPYRAWLVDRHHSCLARVHQQIYAALKSQGTQ